MRNWRLQQTVVSVYYILKTPKLHLISWCGNFVKTLVFGTTRPKLCENCAFPPNFHIRKSGEILVFYAVLGLNPIQGFLGLLTDGGKQKPPSP